MLRVQHQKKNGDTKEINEGVQISNKSILTSMIDGILNSKTY